MPELNTDSFVDTVSNTVGILIILTVITIAFYHIKSIEVDPELGKLHYATTTAQRDVAANEKSLAERKQLIHEIRTTKPEETARLDRARKAHEAARGELSKLQRTEADLNADLAELERSRAEYAEAIEKARAAAAAAAQELDADDLSLLAKGALEEIRAGAASLKGQRGEAERAAEAAGTRTKALADRIAALTREQRELEGKIEKLRGEYERTVVIRDPLKAPDLKKRGIWVECYPDRGAAPAEAAQRVLIVNEKNYDREEQTRTLKRMTAGEDRAGIRSAGSAFRSFVTGGAGTLDRSQYFLFFFVRPGAFAVFRDARKLAVDAGWEVRWDPIRPGETLPLGRAATPE